MKASLKKVLLVPSVSLLVALFIFLPTRIDQIKSWVGHAKVNDPSIRAVAKSDDSKDVRAAATALKLAAVDNYLKRLAGDGCTSNAQAILIQTLDGRVLVDHNADTPLNPASVMKLATSYLALKHFGPDYRFKTVAYTFGTIDEAKGVLYGDLIVEADGDPNFTVIDARELGNSIRSQGVRRVEGALQIIGPFGFRHVLNPEFSNNKLRSLLGVAFPKSGKGEAVETAAADSVKGDKNERVLLASHFSQPLREILLYMNAHSDNFYAEQLGWALGGPAAAQEELMTEFHLQPEMLYISHTSGLDYNRITPRASVAILNKMIGLLGSHQMKIEDIMSVAGVDSGTLTSRLRQPGVQGTIIAKTGTLNTTDNGVSTLQGVMYSEQYGPLLFAIFNTGGGVHYFRKEQDRFICDALSEMNLSLHTVRTDNILQPPGGEEIGEVSPRNMRVKRIAMKHGSGHKYHSRGRRR